MDQNTSLLAWCLLRQDFRVFRLDRLRSLSVTADSFRPHRVALLREHLAEIRAHVETSAKLRDDRR
jgi:predicted DNA-binding transcriptional regulator YafY